MVMRVGGLATGMDIESMVNKLMEAERIPLDRMKQEQTTLIWKQDAFREVNRSLLELDQMMLDMKMSTTYQSKMVSSSNEEVVTATGTSSASNGMYEIKVNQLATNAINMGGPLDIEDPNADLDIDENKTFKFFTFNEEGEEEEHTFEVRVGDSLNQVLKRITDADNHARAFYDTQSNRVILETTRSGKYNLDENGPEIYFDSSNTFFTDTLQLDIANEEGGTNAKFIYNNVLNLESTTNSYTLNGINFEFKNTSEENVRLIVNNDVEHSFESIMNFVEKYNEVIDKLNSSQQEEKFRDFHPLTDEQKNEMSDDEIEKWEEKAKSGILRGETTLSNAMFSLRQSWYANVETEGEFTSITQIGITTSNKYMDGGRLEVDEEKLKNALRENPQSVQDLFSNNAEDDRRGLVHRLEDAVSQTMNRIEEQAGKSTHTLENYSLGKQMKDLNERISQFEDRMMRVETRYWNQFTQMEKAIQRMNDQSAQLLSQFGGGM